MIESDPGLFTELLAEFGKLASLLPSFSPQMAELQAAKGSSWRSCGVWMRRDSSSSSDSLAVVSTCDVDVYQLFRTSVPFSASSSSSLTSRNRESCQKEQFCLTPDRLTYFLHNRYFSRAVVVRVIHRFALCTYVCIGDPKCLRNSGHSQLRDECEGSDGLFGPDTGRFPSLHCWVRFSCESSLFAH